VEKMPALQIRYVAYGQCPVCGAEIIRSPECTDGICGCKNPSVTVPLEPTILLRNPTLTRFQEIADSLGVSLEKLINGVLEVGCRMVDEGKINLSGGSEQ